MQKIIAATILIWALAAAIFAPLAAIIKPRPSIDRLLFFPSNYPSGNWNPTHLHFEDVFFFAEDGTRLHGWYCPSDNSIATILLVHGNAGHVASRAPLLKHLQSTTNATVFIFDYRGFGRSAGKPNLDGALLDARAARAKICTLASIPHSKLLIMGESLGGAIAVELAAESAPHALILQSTFSSLQKLAKVHYPEYASKVPATTLDSISQIAGFHGRLFQSHGANDRTVPFELGHELFLAANEPKAFVIIPNSDHNNWLTKEYLKQLDDFIMSVCPATAAVE